MDWLASSQVVTPVIASVVTGTLHWLCQHHAKKPAQPVAASLFHQANARLFFPKIVV